MNSTQLKPWSQLDEEPIATDSAEVPAPEVNARGSESTGSRDWRLIVEHKFNAAGGLPLAMTAAGACWAAAAAAFCDQKSGAANWHFVAVALINCVATAAIVIRKHRASVTGISGPIDGQAASADASTPKALWQNIQHHTDNIENRVAELLVECKQTHLEASLAMSQKRQLELILNSVSDALLVTDRFDQVVFVNPAAIELLGLDGRETQRQSVESLLKDEKLVRLVRHARTADARAARRKVEHEIDGRNFALCLSPMGDTLGGPDSGSAAHGVVALFRDITRERDASKAKSEFVAHVSHELRTPLSSIRAYVEMLVDGEATNEKMRTEYYGIIQTSAERLGRLIDNMLNISRIEAGTVRINKERVAISMIVKEVTDSLRPQAEEKKLSLITELAPVVDQVMADRDLMYQAVLNLVSNAIKYTPEGGQVLVRMFSQDESNSIRIDVTDTGVGIPAEDLPRVFEKFFRVEANKEMAKGTGLGLNLVKNIVEVVHEGKLLLTSTVGKGSTFAIILSKMQ
jgi:two-component system phosphate regulon sensor histidine kinase PhoR